jgi:hypothetical protein
VSTTSRLSLLRQRNCFKARGGWEDATINRFATAARA